MSKKESLKGTPSWLNIDLSSPTGSIETSEPVGIQDSGNKLSYGESKLDQPIPTIETLQSGEYQYYRGQKQSNWDKAANGLIRFAGKTPLRAIEGIVNPFLGTGLALTNNDASKIWDNEVTNSVSNASTALDEMFPLYSTKAAENAHGLSKLAYANTLWGDILDGVSYSSAAMLSGNISSKLLSVMGKAATLGKAKEVFDKVISIDNAGDKLAYITNIDDFLKTQIKDGVKKGTYALVGATTESSDNALNDSKEFKKDLTQRITMGMRDLTPEEEKQVDILAKQAGNSSYLMNLPVIMADNWLTFGKSVFSGKTADKLGMTEISHLVERGTDDIYKAAKKDAIQKLLDKTYGIRQLGKPFIAEGEQEQLQYAITKGVNDFYTKKYYNPGSEDFLESAQKGLAQAFTDKEGWDNFLIGAISGGIFGGAVKAKTEGLSSFKSSTDKNISDAVDLLNSITSKDTYKTALETIMRHSNLTEEQSIAAKNNDDYEYQNKQSDLFLNYVLGRIKTGKIEDLKNDLENFKGLSKEEFENTYDTKLGEDKFTGLKESVSDYIQARLDKVNKIDRLNKSLDNIVPEGDQVIKDRLLYAAFSLEDARDRASKLDKEVNHTISQNTIFNPTSKKYFDNVLYSSLTNKVAKDRFKENIKNSEITPLDQENILAKLEDFDKLSDRQTQFVKEYKELLKPSVQEAIKAKDKEVEQEVSKIVEKHPDEDKQPELTPEVEETKAKASSITTGVDLGTGEGVSESDLKEGYNQLLNLALTHPNKAVVEQAFKELSKNPLFSQVDKDKVIAKHKELLGKPKDEIKSFESPKVEGLKDIPGEIYPRLHNDTERAKKGVPAGQEIQDVIESIVKNGGNLDAHITFSVGNNGIALIKLDGKVIGNISTHDPHPEKGRIIDMIQRSNKELTPFDLGITFGLTKGELAIVPKDQELTPVNQLQWDKSLTGNQTIIYDFHTRKDGKYISGSPIETIDEDLFKPGVNIDESTIPTNLGRFIMVIPITPTDIRYIRVRPAKLDLLSPDNTNKIFDKLVEKSKELLPKHGNLNTEDLFKLDEFNSELNKGFFIALDQNLKVDNESYDGYHITIDIEPKGDIRTTVTTRKDGSYNDIAKIYTKTSSITSLDALLEDINTKLGGSINLTRDDFKSTINKENYINNMVASVEPKIIGKKKLLWSIAPITKKSAISQIVSTPEVKEEVKPVIEELPEGEEEKYIPPIIYPNTNKELRTWDLGDLEGVKEVDAKETLEKLIYSGDKPSGSNESIQDFGDRVVKEISKLANTLPANSIIVTHSQVFKVLDSYDPTIPETPVVPESYLENKVESGAIRTIKGKNGIIYIVRHGDTSQNKGEESLIRTKDVELSKKGIKEAKEAGNIIKKEIGDKVGEIVSSDLPRAQQTASIIDNILNKKTNKKKDKQKEFLINEIEDIKYTLENTDELSDEYDRLQAHLQERLENLRNKYPNNSGIVYRINGDGKPLSQQEIDEVKSILPKFISVELFKHIIDGVKANGIPMGVFKDMVIKLNTSNAKEGTGFHEAFHSIFRTVLSDPQIQTFLEEAKKEYKSRNSEEQLRKDIDRLRAYGHEYSSLSISQLEELIYEEHMADKYMEFKKDQNTKSFFRRLFIIIRDLFRMFKYNSEKLSSLFEDISAGAFVNSEIKDNRFTNSFIGLPVYKLLPAGLEVRTNQWTGDTETIPLNHTQAKSNQMIDTFAAIINNSMKGQLHEVGEESKKETLDNLKEQLFNQIVQGRINNLNTQGKQYVVNLANTNRTEAIRIKSEITKELNTLINNGNLQILKDEVFKKLDIFSYDINEEENPDGEPKEGNDEEQVVERFGSLDSWLKNIADSLPKAIKAYIGFTTYVTTDELTGNPIEVAVDSRKVYNGLNRVLADTPKSEMMDKLYSVSKYNPNIKAVLEQLMSDTGMTVDSEGNVSEPTKNINDYNMFLNAFDNSKTKQLFTLYEETKDGNHLYTVGDSNTNDAKKVTVDQWANQMTSKSSGLSNKEFASKFGDIEKELNKSSKSVYNTEELDAKINKLYNLFENVGMTLSKGYIEYSLLSLKRSLGVLLTEAQNNILRLNEGVIPFTTELIGGSEGFSGIKSMVSKGEDLFEKGEGKGIRGRLEDIAEANGLFDETIGDNSFKNAELKTVYEIIKKSYVLDYTKKLNRDSFINKLLSGEDKNNDLNDKNYKFIKDNYLLNNHLSTVKNLKINIVDGIRDKDSESGVVFGKYDQRTYLAQALAYFATSVKGGNVRYVFRQNEASNTAYVAELPQIATIEDGKPNDASIRIIYNNFVKEFDRITREQKNFGKGVQYKGYNTNLKTGRAFDFTEFKYIEDIDSSLYAELKQAAIDDNSLTRDQKSGVTKAIKTYLQEGIQRYKESLENYGLVTLENGKIKNSWFLPTNLLKSNGGRYLNWDQAVEEHYINDYIMSNSLNELMDGDYAISRKDKVDITKRNKGAMGSGNNYGTGMHRVAYIKDIVGHVVTEPKDGNLIRVKQEGDTFVDDKSNKYTKDQVSKITTNDAQSYQSITHKIFSLAALGRFDQRTKNIYSKILRLEDITNGEQEYLESIKASLNPDKTVTFGMGIYHKTSEHTLVRGMISYIEEQDKPEFNSLVEILTHLVTNHDFDKTKIMSVTRELSKLYKPIPGMEYWHNMANNMDYHGVDQVITESASKGATLVPIDSKSPALDLSQSMTDIPNEYKRLQVETPTGSDSITAGSQLIQLIDSEQDDTVKFTFPDGSIKSLGVIRDSYRSLMSQTRDNSFKAAITYIKEFKDGTIDKKRLDTKLIRSLEQSGADETLLELFSKPYNFNMSNMIDKAEQIILAHFSKGVLSQKVNGSKVSLVSDAGIEVIRDSKGNIVPLQEVKKNPSKYKDYTRGKLRHNHKYPDGVYSECILSERILTKYGLKVGDSIPQELLKSLGYRIPTQDKHSMMAFKIVGLMPNYMEGAGIFPQEIVYLSGADFDIDSEFLQTYSYWLKDGKPVKYGTETSIEDKWRAFKYYKKYQDKEFRAEYNANLKNALLNTTEDENIVKAKVLASTLRSYNLPTNLEEFKSSKGELNNATLNNKILDLEIAMLTNTQMLKEIAYTPASVDSFEEATKKIELLKQQAEAGKFKVKEDNISASDINGKSIANAKNSAGKEGIGIVANKSQVFTFLAKANNGRGSEFNTNAFRFNIGDSISQGYKYLTKKGQRIADTMSTLLSVMTDNAKDPKAGRMGVSLQLLPGFNELLAQGSDEYTAGLVVNQPIVQLYGRLKETRSFALKNDIEQGFTKAKNVKAAISLYLTGKFDMYKELTDQDIKDFKDKYIEPIDKETLEDIIKSKITDKEVLKKHQLNILMQFINIEAQADTLANINTLLKLNKGLDTSFKKLSTSLMKAIKALNLGKMFGIVDTNLSIEEQQDIADETDLINVGKILNTDPLTKGNVDIALQVLDKGKKLFISQTDSFKQALSDMSYIFNNRFNNDPNEQVKVERSFLGYLTTRGYINLLRNSSENPELSEGIRKFYADRVINITPTLLYPHLSKDGSLTLGKQLSKLKGSKNKLIKNNPIVKYLQIEETKDGQLTLVKGRSFVKESPEIIKRLVDGYKELFNNPDTQKFAINMFNYLIVKDNLEFRNNTFIKYIAPFMFDKLSESLDVNISELSKNSPDFKQVFGDSFDNISYNFRKLFATNIANKFRKLKYTKLEGNIGYTIDGDTITFSIFDKTKDTPEYKKYIDYKNKQKDVILAKGSYDFSKVDTSWEKFPALKEMTKTNRAAMEKMFNKPITGVFLLPQFYRFNDDIYELVSTGKDWNMQQHDPSKPYNLDVTATYRKLSTIGNKIVSPYSFGTYDEALTINKQLEANKPTTITEENIESEYNEITEEQWSNSSKIEKIISPMDLFKTKEEVKLPKSNMSLFDDEGKIPDDKTKKSNIDLFNDTDINQEDIKC